jgi:hypothetical protein
MLSCHVTVLPHAARKGSIKGLVDYVTSEYSREKGGKALHAAPAAFQRAREIGAVASLGMAIEGNSLAILGEAK